MACPTATWTPCRMISGMATARARRGRRNLSDRGHVGGRDGEFGKPGIGDAVVAPVHHRGCGMMSARMPTTSCTSTSMPTCLRAKARARSTGGSAPAEPTWSSGRSGPTCSARLLSRRSLGEALAGGPAQEAERNGREAPEDLCARLEQLLPGVHRAHPRRTWNSSRACWLSCSSCQWCSCSWSPSCLLVRRLQADAELGAVRDLRLRRHYRARLLPLLLPQGAAQPEAEKGQPGIQLQGLGRRSERGGCRRLVIHTAAGLLRRQLRLRGRCFGAPRARRRPGARPVFPHPQ
mmetsp:Transcript_88405/g.285549  ORF Transcript_88405/g.285549 Transcript_88405/m.285549 type:complete len:292 (-) Transcript_88405:254-1129(-)